MRTWIQILKVVTIVSFAVCQIVAQAASPSSASGGNDYSFNVATTQPWTDTGLELQTGDVLEITASGTQSCGPQGISGASAQGLPIAGALPGALIAKLQAQGTAVLIASSKEVTVDAPGRLYLGINAGNMPPCKGSYAVKVHRQAQAASSRGGVLKQQLATAAEVFAAGQFGIQTGGSANTTAAPAL